jgi:hypothetical protein
MIQNARLECRITKALDKRLKMLVTKLQKKDSRINKTRVVVEAIEDKLEKEGLR